MFACVKSSHASVTDSVPCVAVFMLNTEVSKKSGDYLNFDIFLIG